MSSPSPSAAPGSPGSLRSANQSRVVRLLREGGESWTQADLARATGLAPATVSTIVRDLHDHGLVDVVPGSGRRGAAVRLSSSAGTVIGIDFGHSHVAVAVGDLAGNVISEDRHHTGGGEDHREALALAHAMLEGLGAFSDESPHVRAVGLGLPAPIADELVEGDAIFPGWHGVNARKAAEAVLGCPALVENDANLGALAEHRVGAGRGHASSVFIKTSSGVGAGIIIDGELFRGAGGTAGEIGHLTLDDQGPVCRCGKRGCLEAYTSTPFVQQQLAGQLPETPGQTDVDTVVAAARDGNIAARRALEEAGLHLGRGLASIVNLLNPALVAVGGDMARAGELLLEPARIGLRRYALDSVASTPIVAGELGARASLVGAILLAAENTDVSSASSFATT
ncbi:ROK family transcriptional regulator [Nocardioides sp.]|uniref:ROK family transcriptional regulator n=1 Tax=Nocardioides sp. TaxID=35761 RepID=UPI0027292CEC|nr:ROK family transcriptional regulator [Nocardioides sp.]MDO9455288.1 ROK family transcriptional regulator [Nocardioides sp.]